MDWARLDLRMPNGLPVSDAEQETVRKLAEEAIVTSEHDPEIVLKAAARALGQAAAVQNLRAYAKQTILNALKKTSLARAKKDPLAASENLDYISDFTYVDKIESVILVRELLDTLSPQDREIFLRRMEGEVFPDIDREMSLKPRTSEFRFQISKKLLREALKERL